MCKVQSVSTHNKAWHAKKNTRRNYAVYIVFWFVAICLGLLSRSSYVALPNFLREYSGDTIWALMVFFLFCILCPKWKTQYVALLAVLFSFSIEISQLYHAPWIDNIRNHRLGGLVLGFGFKYSDLVCYLIGVSLGAAIDWVLFSRAQKAPCRRDS